MNAFECLQINKGSKGTGFLGCVRLLNSAINRLKDTGE